jgi:hypothetical protein
VACVVLSLEKFPLFHCFCWRDHEAAAVETTNHNANIPEENLLWEELIYKQPNIPAISTHQLHCSLYSVTTHELELGS